MTVIAWDGKTLAADKRCCLGGMVSTVTKIRRVDGCLIGGAGDFGLVREMTEWLRAGRDPKAFPDVQRGDGFAHFLVIERDGTASLYERSPFPIRYDHPAVVTIGSGREFARAALFLGKTAAEAVGVACYLDSGCGNGIDTLEFE